MHKRQDIFFIKVTIIVPHLKLDDKPRAYKYVNCKEIKSIENRQMLNEDGTKIVLVHIVELYGDMFYYQISDDDYERLIRL